MINKFLCFKIDFFLENSEVPDVVEEYLEAMLLISEVLEPLRSVGVFEPSLFLRIHNVRNQVMMVKLLRLL